MDYEVGSKHGVPGKTMINSTGHTNADVSRRDVPSS